MDKDTRENAPRKVPPPTREAEWGEQRSDHYGYATEEERLRKRGLEDWELVSKIPECQHNIPYWFIALFVLLLVIGVGFNFPFWGNRPGFQRSWFDWGLPAAVVYVTIASFAIYWIVDLRHIRKEKKGAKHRSEDKRDG